MPGTLSARGLKIMSEPSLTASDLERLRQFDSCTLSNAIERFGLRLRNEGFVNGLVRCRFPQLPPMLGYAVTGRIRTVSPPMTGGWYYDSMEFWTHVTSLPAPRVLVLQDADPRPGLGAFVGEVHARIGRALDCAGYVTNGAVRDLPGVEAAGMQLFAASLSVSHSYAHIVSFGEPVEVGGLAIRPGDLLYGDRHGVLSIPLAIASRLPAEAQKLLDAEGELIELCRSPDFSLAALSRQIHRMTRNGALPRPADKELP
jgi:regulator of RNase E activity RraA